jgi:hypothetical protein
MAEYADREHYIPLRKSDLVNLLCGAKDLPADVGEQFRQFCTILGAIFHFEYHSKLEELKDAYAPFDPDAVTVPPAPLTPEQKQARLDELFKKFVALMERANFKHLDRKAIEEAMSAVSDWGLNMEVDFDCFDRLELFARGDVLGKRTRRRWKNMWRLEQTELPVYQRLVLMVKLRQHRRLGKNPNTEAVYLKIFKDIPKMDLEMLLPGARVQMPGLHRLKLGGSMASGGGLIAYNIGKQVLTGAALGVGAFYGPVVALLGYGYKQYHGYQVTQQTYSLQLTQSLYYQNLDNNAGVLFHVLDEAEEQECREAFLAYYFLLRKAPAEGWTGEQLDDVVEQYLDQALKLKVDFEVGDALEKLEVKNLLEKNGERYRAVPLPVALERIDEIWDNYFKYHNPDGAS